MLELAEYHVRDVVWGDQPGWKDGVLTVPQEPLRKLALGVDGVEDIDVVLCRPGDSIRMNGVVDVIEPRTKAFPSDESTFPGLAGAGDGCGSGRTVALAGMALVAIGRLSDRGETFVQEDCLLDMAGPGARYSPFATNVNLALYVTFRAGLAEVSEYQVIRDVSLRISRHLAGLVPVDEPAQVRVINSEQPGASLSARGDRVAYVCSLISEGPLHDTLLYGKSTADLMPRWISLGELIDGALVSSDVHYSNQRTPTFFYQRNPIVEALLDRPELVFAGIILTLRYGSDGDKRRGARAVAALASAAGVSGVVTHPAVGGNAHVDALEIVAESEGAGIRTALVLQEMAGARGHDFGLVHVLPEADALVSTGNRDELVELAALERVVGPETLRNGDSALGGSTVPLRSYLCSTTQVGAHRLTTSVG